MGRVFIRSFMEPFRSVGTLLLLIGSASALWLVFVFAIVMSDRVEGLAWQIGELQQWVLLCMALPVAALTLPLISGELRDRTLLLYAMQPLDRSRYYVARVLGRALMAAVYFAVTLVILYVLTQALSKGMIRSESNPIPPDLASRFAFVGVSLVGAVLSMSALAPISSSRFGHVVYWGGLYIVVVLARDGREAWQVGAIQSAGRIVVLEVLQPFLVAVDPSFAEDAALGTWYLARALSQVTFGMGLALIVGVLAFSRMELARRL